MLVRGLWLAAGLALAAAGFARAQTADDLTQQGIRAYRRAEFDAAGALFQRAFDLSGRDTSNLADRSRILDYLAASQFYLGRRDSAVAVYRRILLRDPLHQADAVVFPPEITRLLDDTRRATKVVIVQTAADTTVPLEGGSWQMNMIASSFQQVTTLITTESGMAVQGLYVGPLVDSLEIGWDARDSVGHIVPPGRYLLTITSSSQERTLRVLKVPLIVDVIERDTLPPIPPLADSLLLPEYAIKRRPVTSLLGGISFGAAASALPLLIAHGAAPAPARFVIGGAIGFAGIVAFARTPPHLPLPANIAANRARRDAWQAQSEERAKENARRRSGAGVRIHSGVPTAVGSGVP